MDTKGLVAYGLLLNKDVFIYLFILLFHNKALVI